MRDIPADILAKIQSLNQTIFNNAEPKMEAIIVKAIKTLNIHTIRSASSLGAIDMAMQTDAAGAPVTLWIIAVVAKQAMVTTYDLTVETPDYTTPTSTFTLATQEAGAVRDVAIEFDGAWSGGVLITSGAPHLFWVERGVSLDKIWTVQWDGVGPQPAGTELLSEVR
jgi:hypothetical protein